MMSTNHFSRALKDNRLGGGGDGGGGGGHHHRSRASGIDITHPHKLQVLMSVHQHV
jgi:hypothetical protein